MDRKAVRVWHFLTAVEYLVVKVHMAHDSMPVDDLQDRIRCLGGCRHIESICPEINRHCCVILNDYMTGSHSDLAWLTSKGNVSHRRLIRPYYQQSAYRDMLWCHVFRRMGPSLFKPRIHLQRLLVGGCRIPRSQNSKGDRA